MWKEKDYEQTICAAFGLSMYYSAFVKQFKVALKGRNPSEDQIYIYIQIRDMLNLY